MTPIQGAPLHCCMPAGIAKLIQMLPDVAVCMVDVRLPCRGQRQPLPLGPR